MSAKEMFEALGFEYSENIRSEEFDYEGIPRVFEWSKYEDAEVEYIGGYETRTIHRMVMFFIDDGCYHTEEIVDGALHQAIHQQMKELGWLK